MPIFGGVGFISALGLGVVAAGVLTAAPAAAWQPIINQDLLWLRWAAATVPVRLLTPWPESFGSEALQAVVERSLATWAAPDCGQPIFRFDGAGPTPTFDEEDGVTTIIPITDKVFWDARFGATELARTIIISRASSGHILDADIAVNVGGFDIAAGADCAAEAYDLQATLTHELGHVLGLDHSELEAATMYVDVQPGACAIRALDDDDITGLCTIYPKPAPVEPGPEPVPEPVVEPSIVVETAAEVVGSDTATADIVERNQPGCCGAGAGAAWLVFSIPFAFRRRGRGPQASA